MSSRLADSLDDLRRSLRSAALLWGTALVVLALVGSVTTAALLDAWLRSDSPVVRLVLLAIAVGPPVIVFLYVLLPAWRSNLTFVEIARRIEERDGRWNGRLAGAASFLDPDPARGSTELQQRLVEQVNHTLEREPLTTLVDRDRLKWAIVGAAVAGTAAMLVAITAPTATTTALSRIALPWAAIEWPRDVDLVLMTESGEPLGQKIQIGRDQSLRFVVKNQNGDVPADLALEVIAPGRRRQVEPIPIAEEADSRGASRLVGIASLFASESILRFRAIGGDHRDAAFVTAEVVPPPLLEQLQVTVTPPKYLNAETVTLPNGIGTVTGVVGSSVNITAGANKPLAAAKLHVDDRPGPAVELSDKGRRIRASFQLDQPGVSSYWFRLTDAGGFENPESPRYELRVIADAVPEVTIVSPADDLRLTAAADLPVVVAVSDDHGLAEVRLRFGRTLPDQHSAAGDAEAETTTIPLFGGTDRPTKGEYPLLWSLESLRFVPGDRIAFRAEATDAFDLGPPHIGVSSHRTITIVTAVEKREELLDRQAELLADLTEIRGDEVRLRGGIEALLAQIERAGELRPEDLDLLARIEFEQRRLASRLVEPGQGLEHEAVRATLELQSNGLNDPDLAGRLDRIARELSVLKEGALPSIDRNLTAARKAEAPESTGSALASARADLDVAISGLDALLDDLGAWQSRRDLAAEANELFANQRELAEQTAKAAAETLGTAAGQLSGQQAATLERLALRQAALADRLARLSTTADRLAADPSDEEEPDRGMTAADPRIREAAELLRSAAMPTTARAAGESIRANNLGEAGRLQRELSSKLGELKNLLGRSDSAQPDAESLRQTAETLETLASKQEEALERLNTSRQAPEGLSEADRDALMRDQTTLREASATAGRQLRDLGAKSAASSAGEATRSMSDGLERLRRHDDAAAARFLEDALKRLQEAAQQAEKQADQLGEQLARELAESAIGMIDALSQRQDGINREVARLDAIARDVGRLSRSQLLTLRRTAELQGSIGDETAELAEKLSAAKAVSFALRSALEAMQRHQEALGRKETGPNAQHHGRLAKQRLDQVAAVLKPSAGDPDDENREDEAEGETGEESPPGEGIPLLAQLMLIKEIQSDLLERTKDLERARGESAAIDEPLQQLHAEQAAIYELFLELVNSAAGPEENPE